MGNPYAVTKQLEEELCNYTGSRYAVAVNSCSAALLLSLLWWKHRHVVPECKEPTVVLPRRT